MAKSNRNIPVVFYIGLLLVCLTFFSVHMTSGLYARYTTTASGEDSARVAKFEVTTDLQEQTQELDLKGLKPGETREVPLTVANNSEVAVKIDMSATSLMGELPVKATLQQGSNDTLRPGETRIVTYVVALDISEDAATNLEYCYKVDLVQLTVIVQQVD